VIEKTGAEHVIYAEHDSRADGDEAAALVDDFLDVLNAAAADPRVRPSMLGPDRYGLPSRLRAERAELERFLREHVLPFDDTPADRDRVRRLAGQAGFRNPQLSRGLGVLGTVLLIERAASTGSPLARHAVGPPSPTVAGPALVRLSPLLAADTPMCVAITETGGGSDLSDLETQAVRHGDGWTITGEKTYVTGADEASVALVLARTGASSTAFLVPRSSYDIVATQEMTGDVVTYTLRFDETEVSGRCLVGGEGAGLEVLLSFLVESRIWIAAQALGLAQWCYDTALAHAKRRPARGGTLFNMQGVSFPLVDAAIAVETVRALMYETARRADRAAVSLVDASMLKLTATEQAFAVADRCIQVLGARGLDRANGVEQAQRYLRMLRVVEGSSELQRDVISRLLLRCPLLRCPLLLALQGSAVDLPVFAQRPVPHHGDQRGDKVRGQHRRQFRPQCPASGCRIRPELHISQQPARLDAAIGDDDREFYVPQAVQGAFDLLRIDAVAANL
jgi:alkylation response protein AidB-like acyl-CoA dehydrogenase